MVRAFCHQFHQTFSQNLYKNARHFIHPAIFVQQAMHQIIRPKVKKNTHSAIQIRNIAYFLSLSTSSSSHCILPYNRRRTTGMTSLLPHALAPLDGPPSIRRTCNNPPRPGPGFMGVYCRPINTNVVGMPETSPGHQKESCRSSERGSDGSQNGEKDGRTWGNPP